MTSPVHSLVKPGPDDHARLLGLIGDDDLARGRRPVAELDDREARRYIVNWADEIYNAGGFGPLLRRRHPNAGTGYESFDSTLTRHADAGFHEISRWNITRHHNGSSSTDEPCVLLLQRELGILARVESSHRPGEEVRGTNRITWYFNALLTDTDVFTAVTGKRLPRISDRYEAVVGEHLVANMPDATGFFADEVAFGDAGIAERITVLRASCAFITPWRQPAVRDLGGSQRRPGTATLAEIDADSVAGRTHTLQVLADLPDEVHHFLGAITGR